jgi:hypothetical protein
MSRFDIWKPFKDPVFKDNDSGEWYFWDETWTESFGPYPEERIARDRLEDYCHYIGGCGYD